MSKEEMIPAEDEITAAYDRIEELEREIERKMSAAAFILKERDALQADNARLREALNKLARLGNGNLYGTSDGNRIAQAALAATPEESLVRIRNQVRKELERGQDDGSIDWRGENEV